MGGGYPPVTLPQIRHCPDLYSAFHRHCFRTDDKFSTPVYNNGVGFTDIRNDHWSRAVVLRQKLIFCGRYRDGCNWFQSLRLKICKMFVVQLEFSYYRIIETNYVLTNANGFFPFYFPIKIPTLLLLRVNYFAYKKPTWRDLIFFNCLIWTDKQILSSKKKKKNDKIHGVYLTKNDSFSYLILPQC